MLKRFLPFVPVFLLIACFPPTTEGVDPVYSTAVVQTITATIWTPTPVTPSATPEPHTGKVVELLNNVILGSDPLAETIEARFTILDAQIILDGPASQAGTLRIHVDCEWIFTDSCTPEKSFVVLMHAITANDKILGKIREHIPTTINTLQMVAFDHMTQTGMIIISWNDILDYAGGKISGNQLGSRITRLATSP